MCHVEYQFIFIYLSSAQTCALLTDPLAFENTEKNVHESEQEGSNVFLLYL